MKIKEESVTNWLPRYTDMPVEAFRKYTVLIALLLASSSVAAEPGVTPVAGMPEMWIIPPPWPGDGEPLRQILRRPEEWAQARRRVRGFDHWPWLLNQHFRTNRCRSQDVAVSLIYWAADEPRLARAGQSRSDTWLAGILNQKTAYAQAGDSPDEIVVESWLHVPASAVPDSDPRAFTGSVLEFLKTP